ncbi:MAG: sugar phosphate isomerase/epimerase [Clostridia bacterium]
MEIGISTASFFTKEKTEDAILEINKLKIPVCEIFLGTFSEYKPEFIDELVSRKDGLQVYSIHTLNQQFEPELFSSMDRTRSDGEGFFQTVIEGAEKLGAKYYTFHGPAKIKKIKYNLNYERIGNRVEQLCDFVKLHSHNTTELTYENVHWTYYNEPDYITNIGKYTNVGTVLDIKQAMQSQIDVYDYLDKMGDRLRNVHLCDYDANGKLELPGNGIFDFTQLFSRLLKMGYNGCGMIEVYPDNYKTYDQLVKCYDYLNECLYKAKNNEGEM